MKLKKYLIGGITQYQGTRYKDGDTYFTGNTGIHSGSLAVLLPEVSITPQLSAFNLKKELLQSPMARLYLKDKPLSGTDPVGQFIVEGVALNPAFKLAGNAALYGAGRLGSNYARAKLISGVIDRSIINPIPTTINPIKSEFKLINSEKSNPYLGLLERKSQLPLQEKLGVPKEIRNRIYKQDTGIRIAPNRKPSNLTPEQYAQVRTPEFKKWFGDWIHDPKNASMVVDENGEPLVVYHGARTKGINVFDNTKALNRTSAPDGTTFFTSDYNSAVAYSNDIPMGNLYKGEGEVHPVFLNIRNPLIHDFKGANWNGKAVTGYDSLFEEPIENAIGGKFFPTEKALFDRAENLGIKGSSIDNIKTIQAFNKSTDDLATIAKANNDGLCINNVCEIIPTPGNTYSVFNPTQIKSAVRNNGMFDINNPNIYKTIVGGLSISSLNKLNKKNK